MRVRLERFDFTASFRSELGAFPNKSWQVSFELDGTTAVLIRICTHKEMDRRPR